MTGDQDSESMLPQATINQVNNFYGDVTVVLGGD